LEEWAEAPKDRFDLLSCDHSELPSFDDAKARSA
jgi:hypothetical protein